MPFKSQNVSVAQSSRYHSTSQSLLGAVYLCAKVKLVIVNGRNVDTFLVVKSKISGSVAFKDRKRVHLI